MIRRKDLRYLIVTTLIICMIVTTGVWMVLNPPPTEPFLSLYTLGGKQLLANYYPGDNPNITPNETVLWYVGVYNHESSAQYVELQFKLLNSTEIPPNAASNRPAVAQPFSVLRQLIPSNGTWLIPISWSITQVSNFKTGLRIDTLTFNGHLITSNLGVLAVNGYNFRIVIELWIYDLGSGQFMFSFPSQNRQSAWNQVWFNATS